MSLKGTLSGNYTSPVTLTSAAYANPVTVTGTISLQFAGIDLQAATAWSVVNAGAILEPSHAAYGIGIYLSAGGSVDNLAGGTIRSAGGISITGGAGTVTNAGSIIGGGGVSLAGGGSVDNEGTISGTITFLGSSFSNLGIVIAGGSGTVDNSGTIADGGGVSLRLGGSVNNSGGVAGDVAIAGGAGAVTNSGTIVGAKYGVSLALGGSLANLAGGSISADKYAIDIPSGIGTVTNAGTITSGYGVLLKAGGTVSNAATATIDGGIFPALRIEGSPGTVFDNGRIDGSTTAASGIALYAGGYASIGSGGTVSGIDGIYAKNAAVDVVNQGNIQGNTSDTGTYGVRLLAGGNVSNSGTISGAIGGADTVTNSGSIGAEVSAGRVVVEPGAVFGGSVNAGTLELAAGSGTISGIQSKYDFSGAMTIDPGGNWSIAGANNDINSGVTLGNAGTLTVAGDLENSGLISGNVTLAAGSSFTNAGSITGTIYGQGTVTSDRATIPDVQFAAGFANRMIVNPPSNFGYVNEGTLNGGNTIGSSTASVLELGRIGLGMTYLLFQGFGSSIVNFNSIELDAGGAWNIFGSTEGLAGGQMISGFGPHDTIRLNGVTETISNFADGTLSLTGSAALEILLPGSTYSTEQFRATAFYGTTEINVVACFGSGARILTDTGEVAVEALRPGMLVVSLTHRRLVPVRWVGRREIDCTAHPRPEDVWPVRIEPDAFAPGVPHRVLWLSPDHAVWVGGDAASGAPGTLFPVRYLINGATVAQVPCDVVSYFHVELDRHGVLLAEGMPAESYLDTGNRAAFENGGTVVQAPAAAAKALGRTEGRLVFAELTGFPGEYVRSGTGSVMQHFQGCFGHREANTRHKKGGRLAGL